MKSVPKIIGITAAVAVVVGAGYILLKKVSEFFAELDVEEDSECYW